VFGGPGLCVVFVRLLNKSRRERPMPASDAVLQTAQKLLYPGPETGNIQGDVDAFIASPTARPDTVKRLVTFLILHRHNEVERVGHFVAALTGIEGSSDDTDRRVRLIANAILACNGRAKKAQRRMQMVEAITANPAALSLALGKVLAKAAGDKDGPLKEVMGGVGDIGALLSQQNAEVEAELAELKQQGWTTASQLHMGGVITLVSRTPIIGRIRQKGISDTDLSYRVSIAEMQRMHLRALQVGLVQTAVTLQTDGRRLHKIDAKTEIARHGAVLGKLLREYSK